MINVPAILTLSVKIPNGAINVMIIKLVLLDVMKRKGVNIFQQMIN
jgi:hypothetical protein